MRKPPKNRQRRGLPPPCGIPPAGTRLHLRQGDFRPGGSFTVPAHATSPGSHGNRIGGHGGSIVRAFPWKSGVAAAGSLATGSWEQLLRQSEALAVEVPIEQRSRQQPQDFRTIHVTPPQPGPTGKPHPVIVTSSRGIQRGGPLWRFFRFFLIAEKETPAERPCQSGRTMPGRGEPVQGLDVKAHLCTKNFHTLLEKVWKFLRYSPSCRMMATARSTSSSRPSRMPSRVGSHHTSG